MEPKNRFSGLSQSLSVPVSFSEMVLNDIKLF